MNLEHNLIRLAEATIAAVAVVAFLFGIYALSGTFPTNGGALAAVVCMPPDEKLSLEANAAYVYDIERDAMLYGKEQFQQIPLASVTKLMTALVASELLNGSGGTVTVAEAALAMEGDSGLFADEVWRMQDLIDFTLITSSNDGAEALALAASAKSPFKQSDAFVEAMNERAHSFGLSQSYFLNATGLDISTTTAGAYGSARDVAILATHAYRELPTVFDGSSASARTFTSLSGFQHEAEHTSALAGTLAGVAVAKTGFTDLAGGNLVIVAEPVLGRPVAIAVLGSSLKGRDRDVEALYEYAKSAIKRSLACETL
ncbi:MAG: D-alanyl-D-alanine carboxypeptidase family protein [Candidatus Paceibacteria bacterium]